MTAFDSYPHTLIAMKIVANKRQQAGMKILYYSPRKGVSIIPEKKLMKLVSIYTYESSASGAFLLVLS